MNPYGAALIPFLLLGRNKTMLPLEGSQRQECTKLALFFPHPKAAVQQGYMALVGRGLLRISEYCKAVGLILTLLY
jgi:hypothetical protein